jgi:hypothetical protein
VSPSFALMQKKVLPEFRKLFERQLNLGEYVGGTKNVFTFSEQGCLTIFGFVPPDPVQVFFGHAQNPNSLESATYKACWLDEGGQKEVRFGSWEAILGRLSLAMGRVLITTRPYDLGWLKQVLYDPWEAAKRNHPLIDVVNFESIANPAFPREEWERARASMPRWRFDMKYRGRFTKPAGIIYDCFDPTRHKVPRRNIPDNWPRWVGLDFGGVNTAAVFLAEELDQHSQRTGRLFAYREYGPAGNATAKQHVTELLKGEPRVPDAVGGSKSEDQWRNEFAAAGLGVRAPEVTDVEVGIERVYGAIQREELFVFDNLAGLLDELGSYSRVLDEMGEPTRDIDAKETWHLLDAARYVIGYIKSGTINWGTPHKTSRRDLGMMHPDNLPKGLFLSEEDRPEPGSDEGADAEDDEGGGAGEREMRRIWDL